MALACGFALVGRGDGRTLRVCEASAGFAGAQMPGAHGTEFPERVAKSAPFWEITR